MILLYQTSKKYVVCVTGPIEHFDARPRREASGTSSEIYLRLVATWPLGHQQWRNKKQVFKVRDFRFVCLNSIKQQPGSQIFIFWTRDVTKSKNILKLINGYSISACIVTCLTVQLQPAKTLNSLASLGSQLRADSKNVWGVSKSWPVTPGPFGCDV